MRLQRFTWRRSREVNVALQESLKNWHSLQKVPRGSLEGLLDGWGGRGPCREGGRFLPVITDMYTTLFFLGD